MDSDDDDDVQIVKVTSLKTQKKASSWVTSSFDDFAAMPSSSYISKPFDGKVRSSSQSQSRRKIQTTVPASLSRVKPATETDWPVSRKRQRELSSLPPPHKLVSVVKSESYVRKLKPAQSFDLWLDKHQPKNKDELAVHKKKVDDISGWLRLRTKSFPKNAAPVLVLTGPPGAGKTATMKAVAAELKLDVQEWTNPTTSGGDSDFRPIDQLDWAERSSVDVFSSQSQSSQFSHFLLRANKYQALQLDSDTALDNTGDRLILVEDIPNAFFRNPSELHNIVRTYRRCGHCPLVFIVSDASNSSSNVQRLFPVSLQEELALETISVNPVAPTMMVKVLNKIARVEATQGQFDMPSARVVESIALSSAGDIRSAINALQFACRQDTIDLGKLRRVQKSVKKEKSSSGRRLKYGSLAKQDSGSAGPPEAEVIIGAKDTTTFLFHALGKIMYFKRGDPADSAGHPSLPAHLSHYDRDPLLLTPEEVVEKTHLGGDYFNTFLHQNYVDFVQSVEDLDRASEYLSDADLLSAQYTSRGQLQDYSISVASRGLIHSQSSLCRHTDSRKGQGWKPMHKSQWFATQRQCQESKDTAMRLFRGYHWEPEVLLTELVPYINIINPTLHDPGQFSFVQNLCQYSRSSYAFRSRLEKIDEKDAVQEDSMDAEDASHRPSSSLASDDKQRSQPPSSLDSMDAEDASHRPSSLASDDKQRSHPPSSLDSIEDVGEDNALSGSQSTVKTAPMETEDNDFIIEEFDD